MVYYKQLHGEKHTKRFDTTLRFSAKQEVSSFLTLIHIKKGI